MLKEYFFESIVLLSRILCIDYKVLYVHFRMESSKAEYLSFVPEITQHQMYNFKKYFRQDYKIYYHFNKTFWSKVEDFGIEKMKHEKGKIINLYRNCNIDPKFCEFEVKNPVPKRLMNTTKVGSRTELVETMANAKGL